MKRVLKKILKRWVIGTLIIYAIGGLWGYFTNNDNIPILAGEIAPIWWLYCFITRNRNKHKEALDK